MKRAPIPTRFTAPHSLHVWLSVERMEHRIHYCNALDVNAISATANGTTDEHDNDVAQTLYDSHDVDQITVSGPCQCAIVACRLGGW